MSVGPKELAMAFPIALSALLYLSWLLFSRSCSPISKSSVFVLWLFAFMLSTMLCVAFYVALRFS